MEGPDAQLSVHEHPRALMCFSAVLSYCSCAEGHQQYANELETHFRVFQRICDDAGFRPGPYQHAHQEGDQDQAIFI